MFGVWDWGELWPAEAQGRVHRESAFRSALQEPDRPNPQSSESGGLWSPGLGSSPQPGWVWDAPTAGLFRGQVDICLGSRESGVPCIVTAPQGHFSLLQATTEPLSPPQSTRYAPIPTHLAFLPDFSAQSQGNMRLACPPLFLTLAPMMVVVNESDRLMNRPTAALSLGDKGVTWRVKRQTQQGG